MSMQTPNEESIEQKAREALDAYLARTFLLLANRSRGDADQLCAAHLKFERPTPCGR